MSETILLGRGAQITSMPRAIWETHLSQVPQHAHERLGFMTQAHHQVRYFVVEELPRVGKALQPETIAGSLNLPLGQVNAILDDLERHLTFLVRNEAGSVSWAYPVTVEPTPHKVTFKSGEQLYGAWAEDAIATPFVQGRLREELLTVVIETECKHCHRPMRIEMDSNLNYRMVDENARPLVFMPEINWAAFREPNIIHAYWTNSVFFWSEEHAREYRAGVSQVDGEYFTLEQMAYLTPVTQGTLFAFRWDSKNFASPNLP